MEWISKLHKYQHVSFDLWLTLIKSNPEFKDHRDLLFRDYFSIDKSLAEVAAVIRKYDILTNVINEKVGKNFNTFEIYYLILDALSVTIEVVTTAQLQEFYTLTEQLLMQHKPQLLPNGLPEVLPLLKSEGITMNILSNTAFIKGSSLRKVLSHYGFDDYFAFQMYSDETGFSKPGIEMYNCAYDAILKTNTLLKNEIIHVGDNRISDYDGALKFGFDAHLLINKPLNEPYIQPA
jgi:putative hydrolase of the HAD superfamily